MTWQDVMTGLLIFAAAAALIRRSLPRASAAGSECRSGCHGCGPASRGSSGLPVVPLGAPRPPGST